MMVGSLDEAPAWLALRVGQDAMIDGVLRLVAQALGADQVALELSPSSRSWFESQLRLATDPSENVARRYPLSAPVASALGGETCRLRAFMPAPPERGAAKLLELGAQQLVLRLDQLAREQEQRAGEERHRDADAQLLGSSLPFRALFDSMEEGVVLHDRTGKVIKSNAAAQRILQTAEGVIEEQNAHGPPLAALLRRDGTPLPDDERPAAHVLRTGEPVRGYVMGMAREGKRTVWLSINAIALRQTPDAPLGGAVVTFRDITAELVLQESLSRSLREFGALVAKLPVGVALSHGRTMRYVNRALVEMLGYDDAAELEGRETSEVIHPSSERALADRYAAMRSGKHPGPGLLECKKRDGSSVLLEVTSLPSVFEGEPAILAVIRDVTESTRARAAQELSELRFRTLIALAPVGIFEVSPSGKCLYVNEQACRLAGVSREEFMNDGWLRTLHPDDRASAEAKRTETRQGGGGMRLGLRFVHEGETVFVRLESVPLIVEGKPSGFMGVMVDLTALNEAQAALARSEASFRQLAERAPIGITVRVGSELAYVNPAMARINGKGSAEALTGLDPLGLVAPESRERLRERIAATLRGEAVGTDVFSLRRPGGDEVLLEVDSINVEFRGKPATMSLLRDVTELEQARRDRDNAHGALLESLGQKETLLKEVHHRVKNNLQVIASLLRLGRGYVTDTKSLTVFDDSLARLHSIALIHEQLYQSVDLGRIEMNRYLPDLVAELMRAASTQHRVATQVRAAPIFLSMDRCVPLGLIVNELVNNALKHAFNGPVLARPPRIEVSLTESEDGYELLVADNGSGVDPEKSRQSSLGLRLVASLSRQLGGSHRMQEHTGTVCRVVFPKPAP